MGIGKSGAKNAAVLAVRILAISDSALQVKLEQHALDMAKKVAEKNKALTM
jgi:phosphoribosylamine--glycine ligase